MRIGSFFSGIGGLDLAVPGEHAWMCEYDKHCRAVLDHRFPGVPVFPDVRELGADTPAVDILAGGYPCQPFSHAGKRLGEADPRHLWPEFARCVGILRPRFALLENVSGHLRLGFDSVLADLARLGYDARWVVVRASDVGAPHRRERLFVIASDSQRERRAEGWSEDAPDTYSKRRKGIGNEATGTSCERKAGRNRAQEQPDWGVYEAAIWQWERVVGSAPHPTDERGRLMPEFVEWMMGFPQGWTEGQSRTQRLKMLGNAVVPQQCAYAIDLMGGFR